jgi:glycosyltransferase involved in cell wall biosynthesis
LSPDVLHTHQIGAAWYLGQAAYILGRPPVLHTEHGNEFARSKSLLKNLKVRLFIHQTEKFIGQFCCVSDEIARGVTRWWTVPRTKVVVIPNGIQTDSVPLGMSSQSIRKLLGISDDALVVGTVGRLAEVKRHDLLIRAVSKLLPFTPELHLMIVGDGPMREKLQVQARELSIEERVHFTGYQMHPEQYLRTMDVFALTSRSEGFPVSLLEAWVADLPVVCSAVGGIPDIVTAEQNGLLFPSGDEGVLISALSRLIADHDLRERLASAGNRLVRERYSLERMASDYEARYRALLATGRGAR